MTIPLYFPFRLSVHGRGFVADVRIRGRVTCMEEYGSTCLYGVNPGGLAAGGEDMNSAYFEFRAGLAGTLFDFANDAATFDDFEAAARSFIDATDEESVREWEEARHGIRKGSAAADDINLRRETEALPAEIKIQEIRPAEATPRMNPEPAPASKLLEIAA